MNYICTSKDHLQKKVTVRRLIVLTMKLACLFCVSFRVKATVVNCATEIYGNMTLAVAT